MAPYNFESIYYNSFVKFCGQKFRFNILKRYRDTNKFSCKLACHENGDDFVDFFFYTFYIAVNGH